MFVRRLKILLGLAVALAAVVLCRCIQVQVFQRDRWNASIADAQKHWTPIEPVRGRILDYRGRVLACDDASRDAAIAYQAIVRDSKWMKDQAIIRLQRRGEYTGDREHRKQLVAAEAARMSGLIEAMWGELSRVSGCGMDEIDQTRQSIIQRVEMRKRLAWYNLYQRAADEAARNRQPSPWYDWLLGGKKDDAPDLDSFRVTVGEENESHVFLRGISPEVCAELTRNLDDYPGLEIRQSAHRHYTEPGNVCACCILGRLSVVTREDVKNDPNFGDPLQRYLPNDLIGRQGIEKLAEEQLRGSRGRQVRSSNANQPAETIGPVAGRDVRLTIDIELQNQVLGILQKLKVRDAETGRLVERIDLHGAAVIIDVPTGEVRALVSNPTFDLNRWDMDYARMATDDINQPTLNRATMAQLEPGSTAKVMIGSAALTKGLLRLEDTVECRGYLYVNGQRYPHGRCWIATQFESRGLNIEHHQIPSEDPHPTGFLNIVDALQRSCNVFFETTAGRMGLDEVAAAFANFGLGHPTGIGIAEATGHIPDPARIPPALLAMSTWAAGIGQGPVRATPIQMANVAATLARDGMWVRPHLVADGPLAAAERRNLGLTREAVKAVRDGMKLVVNSRAGTGTECRFETTGLIVAAKTGSAQAGKFSIPLRDEQGRILRKEDGTIARRVFEPGELPWYQGVGDNHQHLAHAWYIGYAPADNPRIAFAVMIEYGGSGGLVAGSVARDMLEACIEHGYLAHGSKTSGQRQPKE